MDICRMAALISMLITSSYAQNLTGKLAYSRVLLYKNKMTYNPTEEYIFPTVIKAPDHISKPLGTYYLYYAPHDAPGGICLAYSNSISGPYQEYSKNPILTNTHHGEFKVSHVSSPHVIWMPQYNKYFMYFHGENTATRWAYSTDGLKWEVNDYSVAIRTDDWGNNFTECSYAKVYEHTIPGLGNKYIMVMMLIRSGYGRRIGLAVSNDGKRFTPHDEALVSPGQDEGKHLGAPAYWVNNGRHYIVYHSVSGNIHLTEVGDDFSLENHMGVFYDPDTSFPEFNKAADPFLFYEEDRWHMFYTAGSRLEQTIAYAHETPSHDLIIDNTSKAFTASGAWTIHTSTPGFYGSDYLRSNSANNEGSTASWQPDFPTSGYYKVMVRWPAQFNGPDSIRYKVYARGAISEATCNQQTENGSWVYLGRFLFDNGSSEKNKLVLDAGSDTGYTTADAARFIYDGQSAEVTHEN
jgi:hypothetical protein